MRAVVQRVREATVTIDGAVVGRIGPGLAVLVGVERGDTADDVDWLAAKVAQLRIFVDDEERMNRDVREIGCGPSQPAVDGPETLLEWGLRGGYSSVG